MSLSASCGHVGALALGSNVPQPAIKTYERDGEEVIS
jgi:hypothetical protein